MYYDNDNVCDLYKHSTMTVIHFLLFILLMDNALLMMILKSSTISGIFSKIFLSSIEINLLLVFEEMSFILTIDSQKIYWTLIQILS